MYATMMKSADPNDESKVADEDLSFHRSMSDTGGMCNVRTELISCEESLKDEFNELSKSEYFDPLLISSRRTLPNATIISDSFRLQNHVSSRDRQLKSLHIIQRWWLKVSSKNRFHKYTQNGRWSLRISNCIFALLLGYRVRHLLRLPYLKSIISAHKDISRVLSDLLTKHEGNLNPTDYSSFSATDKALVQSLVKQLLAEKLKLHNILFSNIVWKSFPYPGYWDLSGAFQLCSKLGRNGGIRSDIFSSPKRHSDGKEKCSNPRKAMIDTPPRCSSADSIQDGGGAALEKGKAVAQSIAGRSEVALDSTSLLRRRSLQDIKAKRYVPKSLKDILADKDKQLLPPTQGLEDSRTILQSVSLADCAPVIGLLSPFQATEKIDSGFYLMLSEFS